MGNIGPWFVVEAIAILALIVLLILIAVAKTRFRQQMKEEVWDAEMLKACRAEHAVALHDHRLMHELCRLQGVMSWVDLCHVLAVRVLNPVVDEDLIWVNNETDAQVAFETCLENFEKILRKAEHNLWMAKRLCAPVES